MFSNQYGKLIPKKKSVWEVIHNITVEINFFGKPTKLIVEGRLFHLSKRLSL